MDIIRCIACFSVVSVHFFHNNGFYGYEVNSTRMYIMTFMRACFMICVPLFIMLSGYLMNRKKPELSYYKKIGRILFVYVAVTIATAIYNTTAGGKEFVFRDALKDFLNFDLARYAWYLEMYIGLFLIIPFLNILYNNIPTPKLKRLLILTALVLTALPAIVNVYNFSTPGWFSKPSSETGYWKLMPSWWTAFYPVTYYFIGCYLREFGLKIKTSVNVLLLAVSFTGTGFYNIWRSAGAKFVRGAWGDWPSILNVINAVLVFSLFMNLKYTRMPRVVKVAFAKLSDLCFAAYMMSGFFDTIFYKQLNAKVPSINDKLNYYFIIVPASFICAVASSYIIMKLYRLTAWLCGAAARKFKKKEAEPSA